MESHPALIAVVDDEASVRKAICRALRLSNYEAMPFANGLDLLASSPAPRIDCVVMDVHMPGLTGLEVVPRLRAQGMVAPVILVTASDEAGMPERARAAGATHFLTKPFSMDVLTKVIERVLA